MQITSKRWFSKATGPISKLFDVLKSLEHVFLYFVWFWENPRRSETTPRAEGQPRFHNCPHAECSAIMVLSLVILINSLTVLIAPIRLSCCALSVATCSRSTTTYPRLRSLQSHTTCKHKDNIKTTGLDLPVLYIQCHQKSTSPPNPHWFLETKKKHCYIYI